MTAATPSTPVSRAERSWGRARTTIEPSASARAAPAAIATEAARPGSEIAPRVTCAVTPCCRYPATRRRLPLCPAALALRATSGRASDLLRAVPLLDGNVVAIPLAAVDL